MTARRPLRVFIFIMMGLIWAAPVSAFSPDTEYLHDREALEALGRAAFNYMWEDGDPDSGMAYEADFGWETRPVAVGGTGFGVAALVVATDRGWVGRNEAVERLLRIVTFLRDKAPRAKLHGALPHWLNGSTGETIPFGAQDDWADIVETSLLMQGLLIARAYFNGPGSEEDLRRIITELWQDVDWDWFTNGEHNGLYWHWSPRKGYTGLKILGYNEALITYVLALSSPTKPISQKAYRYWSSGWGYRAKKTFGYRLEATLPGGGPLFLAHYSFIGLDPKRLADKYVPSGYFVRGITQTLSNRGYCLQDAPPQNRYSDNFWGLSASQIKGGYTASSPLNDQGVVAPTAALASMPYTPHYSMLVLHNLREGLGGRAWGRFGPYDGINLRDEWISPHVLAIDQLPITAMVENYRSGLLWNLLMTDPDIKEGLKKAGLAEPAHKEGFPEVVVTLKKDGGRYVPDAFDLRRHPDTGLYEIPFWRNEAGETTFSLYDPEGPPLLEITVPSRKGRNKLTFNQFRRKNSTVMTLLMTVGDKNYELPVRLH
ncbi:beta-glucosidase [Deltaproteobacteria bacterium Smac51]|nr:beta-glucosidase [Deltaproteobacteria bacterium Smac51]